jgi:hypothetical protein
LKARTGSLLEDWVPTNVAWKDVNYVEAGGRYPFRDDTIDVTDHEVVLWKNHPVAVFS